MKSMQNSNTGKVIALVGNARTMVVNSPRKRNLGPNWDIYEFHNAKTDRSCAGEERGALC